MNTFTDIKEYMDNLSAFMEGNLSGEEWSQYCKRLLAELLEENKATLNNESTNVLPTSVASKSAENPV